MNLMENNSRKFKQKKYLDKTKIKCDVGILSVCGHVGVGGIRGRIYSVEGIAQSVSGTQWKDAVKVVYG